MKSKMKNALIFGGFILLNFFIGAILTGERSFTKTNIFSSLIVTVVFSYIFGFILKGSFGWKNKNDDI
ncbi:MAG: hypothetical protein ABI359_05215 [Ginsengibacter sp.]